MKDPVCQIYNGNDLNTLRRFVTDILSRQANLKPDRRDELQASLTNIRSQLSQRIPDTSLINSSFVTVKSTLEGATANVVASGWLKGLARIV